MKRKFLFLGLNLFIIFVLLSCSTKTDFNSIPEEKLDSTFSIAIANLPTDLDPATSTNDSNFFVTSKLYNTLFKKDIKGNISPELVSRYEYISPLEIVITLRPYVVFHNGDELTSDDAVFSLNRVKSILSERNILPVNYNAEIIDKYSFKITLEEYFEPLLSVLCNQTTSIVSSNNHSDLSSTPMGTGPYKLESFNRDNGIIILNPFKNYFKGKLGFYNLYITEIKSDSKRATFLRTDDIDIAYDISPIDKDIFSESNLFNIWRAKNSTNYYIGLNNKKRPFNNLKCRQTLNSLIDKKLIIDTVFFGDGIPLSNIADLASDNNSHKQSKDTKNLDRNILGHKTLKENRYSFTLLVKDDPIMIQITNILKLTLLEEDININVKILSNEEFYSKISSENYEAFLDITTPAYSEDYIFFKSLIRVVSTYKGMPNFYYYNSKLEALLEKFTQLDADDKSEVLKEISEILDYNIPIVPLFSTKKIIVSNIEVDANTLNNLELTEDESES